MIALFFAQGLFTAAVIAAFTLSPIIAANLAGSDSAAGVPSTLTLVGRALVAYPAGWLMDRVGRRRGLSLGFLLGIGGALVAAAAVLQNSFLGFLAGALLLGAMRGFAEQGRFVAAEVYPVAQRARIIGIIVAAGTLGAIGGPLLVDPAEQWTLLRGLPGGMGPFLIAGFLLLLGLLTVFIFVRPDPLDIGRSLDGVQPLEHQNGLPSIDMRLILRRPALRLAILAMTIGQLVMTLLMVVTPLYMNHHDQGTKMISWVIMAHTLGMYGLSGVSGWLVGRFGRVSMIVAGTLTLILSAVLAPFAAGIPLLALALFLLGLGWNLCYVAGSALVSDSVSADERGRVQGASEALVAIGSGVGSLGAGVLFQWSGSFLSSGMFLPGVAGLVACLVLLAAAFVSSTPNRAIVAAEGP
jgi:MFS family permease